MLTLNPSLLATVIADATQAAAAHPRWLAAIARAVVELERNPWIEVNGSHLLIGSESGNYYDVNGSCQCHAYIHGQACWHRAARQLVARYVEAEARSAPVTEHISVQARKAYAAANGPRKPLFADRDAETLRRHALAEDRALLEEQRLQRKIAAAKATAAINELFA